MKKNFILNLILVFIVVFFFLTKTIFADGVCMIRPFSLIGKVLLDYPGYPPSYSQFNFPFVHEIYEYNFRSSSCDCNTSNSCCPIGVNPTPVATYTGSNILVNLKIKLGEDPALNGQPTAYTFVINPQKSFQIVDYKLCYWTTNCQVTPTPMAYNNQSKEYYTPYDLCCNVPLNTYFLMTPTPGKTTFAYVEYRAKPLIPNCSISCYIQGGVGTIPIGDNLLIGDPLTCQITFQTFNNTKPKKGEFFVYKEGNCETPTVYSNVTNSNNSNSFVESSNWQPLELGTYYLHCAASSETNLRCIGQGCTIGQSSCTPPERQCVNPISLPCVGPNASKTLHVNQPTAWYKLKDASLNKIGDHNIAVVQNVTSFDSDDPPNNRYTIINSTNSDPGILLATGSYNPGPSYNPVPDSVKNWHLGSYSDISRPLLDNFYQYIISRKKAKEINNLDQITTHGIYIIKSNSLTLSDEQLPNYNFVLIVKKSTDNNDLGEVNITNNFNSGNKSIMILAKKITFSSSVTTARGIFIAQTIEYQSTNGLKILGNLISKTAVSLQSRSDNTRPSLFIVFKPKMYLDLLPYLSISKYDWRQLQ